MGHVADVTVIVIILISVVIGLIRGFVKETLSLCTWVAAIWLGVLLHNRFSDAISHVIHNQTVRSLVAFGVIFTVILVLGSLITYVFSLIVKRSGISGTDRLLGFVFGMARGIVLVTLILTVLSYTAAKKASWWEESVAITKFEPLIAWVNEMVPEQMNFLKNTIDKTKSEKKSESKDVKEDEKMVQNDWAMDALGEVNLLEEDDE